MIQARAVKAEIKTAAGDIVLLTADDPKVVAKIHEHIKKTDAEHAKMKEMMEKQGAGKESSKSEHQ